MRRKEDGDLTKKKQTTRQQTFDHSYETEISILVPYLKILPITMRSKILFWLKLIKEKEQLSQTNKQLQFMLSHLENDTMEGTKNIFLAQVFCRFLKLNKLRQHFLAYSKKVSTKEKQHENSNDREGANGLISSPQPNIQRQSTTGQRFQPQHVINPNYENIIKMYKNFTDTHMNMEYKIKSLNESYRLFSQPRFITKLLDMHDIESGFSEKGNIMMMTFQGSKIVGSRGFAFVSNSSIYWWEKCYKDYKEILPEVNIDDKEKDKQDKDKQKNRKKQAEKEQPKNQQPQPPKYSQNFQLSYKMVGHHGKITSLSLSDDEYYLLSAGTDKTIKLWCLRQKCLLAEYRGHTKTIWSVSFSKSGYFFLSGSADFLVKLWSTDDSIAQRVYSGHTGDVTKVDFLKNPDLMISASEDKTIRIWNTFTPQCISKIKLESTVINLKTSISGRYLAFCDMGGKISLYDLYKDEHLNSFKVPQKQQTSTGKTKYLRIHDICFSLDQKQFSCVSSKYIVVYSLDKISEKQSKNLFLETGKQSKDRTVATKEVIYTGRDSNLVFCEYQNKGLLLVASTSIKKY